MSQPPLLPHHPTAFPHQPRPFQPANAAFQQASGPQHSPAFPQHTPAFPHNAAVGPPWPQSWTMPPPAPHPLSHHRPRLSRAAICLAVGGLCTLGCCLGLLLMMLLGLR